METGFDQHSGKFISCNIFDENEIRDLRREYDTIDNLVWEIPQEVQGFIRRVTDEEFDKISNNAGSEVGEGFYAVSHGDPSEVTPKILRGNWRDAGHGYRYTHAVFINSKNVIGAGLKMRLHHNFQVNNPAVRLVKPNGKAISWGELGTVYDWTEYVKNRRHFWE